MPRIFLDTTIVVELVDDGNPRSSTAPAFLSANQPAEAPVYALRELLAGPLQNACAVHNGLKASENLGEALSALARLNPVVGRKKSTQIEIFARELTSAAQSDPGATLVSTLNDMTQSLALKVARIWRRAQKTTGVALVQPLGCFPGGDFSVGPLGELKPPSDTFNCDPDARCSAAAYMQEQGSSVSKLCDALHPNKLSEPLASKGETASRRAALKELRDRGAAKFNKRRCRALGDAYFAVMCPATAKVATTNAVDFEPLCAALGKEMITP